jgi:hypothetical protein
MKVAVAITLLFLLVAASIQAASMPVPKSFWLPIVATRNSVAEAVDSAKRLSRDGSDLRLVVTDDCRNLHHGLYVVVAGVFDAPSEAKSAVDRWRRLGVKDAYLRSCDVVIPSRLSLNIPLLDPSLIGPTIEAVNWGLDDAVSRLVAIDGQWAAAIVPRYEPDSNDIREGLRIGVRLYGLNDSKTMALSDDCIDPEFAVNASLLALTCVTEAAADHLLHRTQFFALPDGKQVGEENRCTQPTFKDGRWLCQIESVDAEGVLRLEAKSLSLH